MAEDDGYRAELDERAKRIANQQWRRAMEGGPSVDRCIEQARKNAKVALGNGNDGMVFFWETVEFVLDSGQRLGDKLRCDEIEEADKLNEAWPADYGKQLDAGGIGW